MHDVPKIYVDAFAETRDLLTSVTTEHFYNYSEVDPAPGSIYVVGRVEVSRNLDKIKKDLQRDDFVLVFTSAAEGSETMLGQLITLGIKDLADQGRLKILSGGDMGPYQHLPLEYFLIRSHQYEENMSAGRRVSEIFSHTHKPYKFLFLNGRLRHHRKWMLRRLDIDGLLDQGLWTCLQTFNHNSRGMTLMHQDRDLMRTLETIKLLPAEYEHEKYRQQVGHEFQDVSWVKPHLFGDEWGDVYINPAPYIDTYFSLVSETVFDSPYSFRTEKIWKPIIMGHPWICMANSGFYRDIRNMGFRTFDGIIDESFDTIDDSQLRIERVYQVVRDLCQGDLSAFLQACQEVCIHNQQHAKMLAEQYLKQTPERFLSWATEYLK